MEPTPAPRTRRLAAYMAACGVDSRRHSEIIVGEGRVTVNRTVITDPAFPVTPGKDTVRVDGEVARLKEDFRYLLLNKPAGILTACSDKGGKTTVMDLVPSQGRRLYPVGRLDWNAEGLVLMTDDGRAAYGLTHPRYQIPRIYLVKVSGIPVPAALERLTRGLRDKGEMLRARRVTPQRRLVSNSWFEVELTEGKNREVRRLFAAIGHPVQRLIRVAFGPLSLGRMKPGESRPLADEEVAELRRYLVRHGVAF